MKKYFKFFAAFLCFVFCVFAQAKEGENNSAETQKQWLTAKDLEGKSPEERMKLLTNEATEGYLNLLNDAEIDFGKTRVEYIFDVSLAYGAKTVMTRYRTRKKNPADAYIEFPNPIYDIEKAKNIISDLEKFHKAHPHLFEPDVLKYSALNLLRSYPTKFYGWSYKEKTWYYMSGPFLNFIGEKFLEYSGQKFPLDAEEFKNLSIEEQRKKLTEKAIHDYKTIISNSSIPSGIGYNSIGNAILKGCEKITFCYRIKDGDIADMDVEFSNPIYDIEDSMYYFKSLEKYAKKQPEIIAEIYNFYIKEYPHSIGYNRYARGSIFEIIKEKAAKFDGLAKDKAEAE